MMTAQREPSPPTAPAVASRSPFVRLTELIAGIAPGKPPINLSVGEPQHAIPPFVGPVIAEHLDDFGRYPPNKGIAPFREAVANGSPAATGCRARSIPRAKCWCSTARARACFSAPSPPALGQPRAPSRRC